jgi:hypothetical protein
MELSIPFQIVLLLTSLITGFITVVTGKLYFPKEIKNESNLLRVFGIIFIVFMMWFGYVLQKNLTFNKCEPPREGTFYETYTSDCKSYLPSYLHFLLN